MEKSGRSSTATACLVFLLLFFMASREAIIAVEGRRTCESQSHGFKGACVSDNNCGLACRNEGFAYGKCRGFRRRCFCTRPC